MTKQHRLFKTNVRCKIFLPCSCVLSHHKQARQWHTHQSLRSFLHYTQQRSLCSKLSFTKEFLALKVTATSSLHDYAGILYIIRITLSHLIYKLFTALDWLFFSHLGSLHHEGSISKCFRFFLCIPGETFYADDDRGEKKNANYYPASKMQHRENI